MVLVIDEVHTLVGSGAVGRRSGSGGGGGLDISNLLKVPLARGELQCIGATTVKEHRLYIEKDPALERRFQPVIVEEPNEDDAVEILFGLRSRCVFPNHHNTASAIAHTRPAKGLLRPEGRIPSDCYHDCLLIPIPHTHGPRD